jgi:hypothetical protein
VVEQVVYRDEGGSRTQVLSAADYEEGLFLRDSFLESSVKTPKKPQNFSRTCSRVSFAMAQGGSS